MHDQIVNLTFTFGKIEGKTAHNSSSLPNTQQHQRNFNTVGCDYDDHIASTKAPFIQRRSNYFHVRKKLTVAHGTS